MDISSSLITNLNLTLTLVRDLNFILWPSLSYHTNEMRLVLEQDWNPKLNSEYCSSVLGRLFSKNIYFLDDIFILCIYMFFKFFYMHTHIRKSYILVWECSLFLTVYSNTYSHLKWTFCPSFLDSFHVGSLQHPLAIKKSRWKKS